MIGWMDGWTGDVIDGWIDGWLVGRLGHVIDSWTDEWLDGCLGGRISSLRDWCPRRRRSCFDYNSFLVPAPIPMRTGFLSVPILGFPR